MDYDFVDPSADDGFLYFWGIEGVEGRSVEGGTVGKFGNGLRVENVSISYWADDAMGCRATCLFCWDTF